MQMAACNVRKVMRIKHIYVKYKKPLLQQNKRIYLTSTSISTQIYNSESKAESGAERVANFMVAHVCQIIRVH